MLIKCPYYCSKEFSQLDFANHIAPGKEDSCARMFDLDLLQIDGLTFKVMLNVIQEMNSNPTTHEFYKKKINSILDKHIELRKKFNLDIYKGIRNTYNYSDYLNKTAISIK